MDSLSKLKSDAKIKFAKARLEALAGFRQIPSVEIEEIPLERTLFPGTIDSYWYREETEGNENVCIYEMSPLDKVFNTHWHTVKEDVDLLSDDADVEWVTERGISYHKGKCRLTALKGERHALVSRSGKVLRLRATWSPKMIGWGAMFEKMKQINEIKNK